MEYYNVLFLQAITNLMLEYKRLAEEKIHLENPKPITMGMWIGRPDGNHFKPLKSRNCLRQYRASYSNYYISLYALS